MSVIVIVVNVNVGTLLITYTNLLSQKLLLSLVTLDIVADEERVTISIMLRNNSIANIIQNNKYL